MVVAVGLALQFGHPPAEFGGFPLGDIGAEGFALRPDGFLLRLEYRLLCFGRLLLRFGRFLIRPRLRPLRFVFCYICWVVRREYA